MTEKYGLDVIIKDANLGYKNIVNSFNYYKKQHHLECEEKNGTYKNIVSYYNDAKFKYYCPLCKKKTVNALIRNKTKKLNNGENSLKKKRTATKVNSSQNGKKIILVF